MILNVFEKEVSSAHHSFTYVINTVKVPLRQVMSLDTHLWHASAAPITLYGETSNSPKLFTKLTIKFHI